VAALALVPVVAAPLSADDTSGWPVAITYSFVLLATAIALIALEFLGRQGAARIGAALIALLVILRMADADVSLLIKGLAFIVIGSGFLAFNAFITRRRRVAVAGGSPA
jgi:dipeptide/tripeptide permease